MRHKALASYPGVYVSLLIVTVFLGSAQGGAVGTRLIFPDLTQAPSVAVGYAVLNPLAQATRVTFTAYGVGGALLDGPGVTNPVTLDVGPRSQLARFPADLFGFALDSEVTGWMEVTSDSEEIKGFFITLEDGLDRIDGADATTNTSTSFILMFPPGADPAAGLIHLVNPGDAAANATVELLSASGALLDDTDRVIPAHGKLQASPAQLVSEIESEDSVYLKVTSDQPIRRVLETLKQEQRSVLTLKYVQGYSYSEIEERTGYTYDQVRSYLQNARRNFQIRWTEQSGSG